MTHLNEHMKFEWETVLVLQRQRNTSLTPCYRAAVVVRELFWYVDSWAVIPALGVTSHSSPISLEEAGPSCYDVFPCEWNFRPVTLGEYSCPGEVKFPIRFRRACFNSCRCRNASGDSSIQCFAQRFSAHSSCILCSFLGLRCCLSVFIFHLFACTYIFSILLRVLYSCLSCVQCSWHHNMKILCAARATYPTLK